MVKLRYFPFYTLYSTTRFVCFYKIMAFPNAVQNYESTPKQTEGLLTARRIFRNIKGHTLKTQF